MIMGGRVTNDHTKTGFFFDEYQKKAQSTNQFAKDGFWLEDVVFLFRLEKNIYIPDFGYLCFFFWGGG